MRRLIVLLNVLLLLSLLPLSATVAQEGYQFPPPEPTPTRWPDAPVLPLLPGGPVRLDSYRIEVDIVGQVATTHIVQRYVNDGSIPAEIAYLFPLPDGAAVSDFLLWVDGQPLEAQLLDKDTARSIYETIVSQLRDPALLEFVGRDLIQASIFPVPPGGERTIELTYHQILPLDEGLFHYRLPLRLPGMQQIPIGQLSVTVNVASDLPLRALYSPTHPVDIAREGDNQALIGFEATDVVPETDFDLYFSTSQEDVGLSLLTYKPAGEDGYFLLIVAPKADVEAEAAIARDVVIVLDTSGSMQGEKIEQAKASLTYLLDQLGPEDRFNVITFSTGVRLYASGLRPASERAQAQRFVDSVRAAGSTDIHRALMEAFAQFDSADAATRPAVVFFLTDGLPTVGVTDAEQILANVQRSAPRSLRLFAFGVGYDVNTVLLDSMSQEHLGVSAYVEPSQPIQEVVSGLYAKVAVPVLMDLDIDFGAVVVEDVYPYPLPDLYAGRQLVVTGRYRAGGTTDIVLRGQVNGASQTFVYEGKAFAGSGGEPFVAPLWARRKIGYLLTQVKLSGGSREVIEEIVDLSVRYGIVTPYTSYLVVEPGMALSEGGRASMVDQEMNAPLAAPASGEEAVKQSMAQEALRAGDMAYGQGGGGGDGAGNFAGDGNAPPVRYVHDKAFVLTDGIWTDTRYDAGTMRPRNVAFGSPQYFDLLRTQPALAPYLAVDANVIVVWNGVAYRVTA